LRERTSFVVPLIPSAAVALAVVFASPPSRAAPASGAPPAAQKEGVVAPAEPAKPPDFVFIEAETGAAYVGLETITVRREVIPRLSRREDVGPFVGAMAGVKLVFLAAGPHLRLGHFQDWDLLTLDLDVAFHAPLGSFEPFLRIGGGYARLARAFESLDQYRGLTTHGYHIALTVGADFFLARSFTLGGRVSGDLVALHRAGVDLNSQDGVVNDYLKYDAASAGLGMSGALALGLHF
jgi:hypothetical protein